MVRIRRTEQQAESESHEQRQITTMNTQRYGNVQRGEPLANNIHKADRQKSVSAAKPNASEAIKSNAADEHHLAKKPEMAGEQE